MAYNNEKLENVCRTLKAKGVYGGTVDELKRYLDAKPENFNNFLKTLKDKNIYGGTAEELSRYIGYTAPTATTTTPTTTPAATTTTPAPTAVGGVQQPQEEKGFWDKVGDWFDNLSDNMSQNFQNASSNPQVTKMTDTYGRQAARVKEEQDAKDTRERYTADPYRDDAAYIAQNDEDIRNGKYTLKEEKTDEDIRDNQLALYNATPEGKAEYDKMNTACNQKQNEYFERFSKTVEYDKLMKEYQSAYNAAVGDSAKEEVEKRYNALLNDKLAAYGGEEYEKALEDIYSRYYEKARTARQNSWEGAETRLWQPITDSLANETLKKVNEGLTKPQIAKFRDKDGNIIEEEWYSLQKQFGHRNFDDIRNKGGQQGQDFFTLKTAQSSLEETQKLIDAAKKYDERNLVENLWQGVWDKLSDGNSWGVGFATVIGDKTIKNLVEKADRGEKLTENEELLMDALAIELYAHAFYDYKIGHAYKAGQTTGESIPFMLEMAISPFSAVGKTLATKVATWGLRRGFAKGAVTTLKVGARFGGEMLGAAGKTALMDADAVGRGVTQRMTGDINIQFEYNKELGTYTAKYNGRENMQGAGEALWNSGVSQFNENFSEVFFTPFKGLGIGRKIFKKIPVGGKFLSEDAKKSFGKFYDGIQRAKERFKIGSYGEEGGEEEVNNGLNVLFTTDTKAEDVFSREAQIDTWLGLLPMQVAFGLLGGGAKVGHKAYGKYQKWHANRKADNNWKEWLDKQPEADRNFYNMLQERLDAGDIEVEGDVKNYIRKVLADPKTKYSEKEEKLQALAAQLYDKQSDEFQKVIHDYYGKNFDDARGKYRNAQDPSKIIFCSVKDYQANTYRLTADGSYFIDLGENGNTDERGVPMHNLGNGHNGEIIEMPADAIAQEGAIDYDEVREKYINHTQAVAVAHNRFEEGDKIVNEEAFPGKQATIKGFDSDGVTVEIESENGTETQKISYEDLVDYYQTAEDKQMEDASDKIDEQSNTSNGHVTNVKIGGSEGTFYVKSGNLVVSTDKNGNPVIDKEKSDGTFVVVDSETGEAKQIGIDQIEAVLGDAHKSEMKAQADENIRQAAYNAKHYPEGSIIYNTNTPEIGLTTVVSTDASGITYNSRNEQTGEVEQSVITNDQRGQWAVLNFEEGDVLQTQMHTYEIVSHDAQNKLYTVRIDGAEETEGVSSQELADILTSEQFDTAAFVESKQAAEEQADNEQADTNNEQGENTTQEGQQEITTEQGENGAPQVGEGGSETTPETTTEQQDEFSEYSDADIAATLEDIKKQLQKQQEIASKPISLIDDKAKAKRAKAQEEIKRLQELYDKFNAVYAQRMQAAEAKRAEEKAAAEKAAQEAAAAKKEAEEAARLEAEKKAGGVPDVSRDSAAAARKRGYRMVNGNVVKRQENTQGVYGKEVEIMFSTQDKPKGRVKVIDASQLQPSHKGGQRNHSYFITEAQPKERTDKASQVAAQKIAENINPQQITEGATAYTGAPVTNTRGEVIQGNNRSIALLMMYDSYPDQAAKYKQYLIDNAERFGLNAEEVAAMQNPVLVTELDVTDEEAIRLGQKNAQDTESGGKQTIDAAKTAQMLGDGLASFARRLTTTNDEEMTLSEMIAANGGEAIKFLRLKDIINDTQYQTAFNDKGELTDEAKNSLLDILRNLLFANAKVDNIREMFTRLPLTAQKAILQTVARDANSPADAKVVPYLQEAIEVFYNLQSDPTFIAAKTYEERMAAIWAWSKQLQMDFVGGSFLPAEKFSNFAFALAATFKSQTMATQRAAFNELYDKLQGEGGDLFNATEKLTLEQAVEQIYHVKLNKHQNNVTNDGSPVLGNSSKTGGSGQLGENGGTGSAKPLEGGTQSTNNRGGVGGNNQKGEGTTEKPLTPPTPKNEKKGGEKIQVEGEPFPDDISERSTMERTISKREERKQDGFAPSLGQSIKVGFKGNDIFIQIDTEDEDHHSSSQFVVRNAAQKSIEEIADELGRNEIADLDEEQCEALKSMLYERAIDQHLRAIIKGYAAYSKASATDNAETTNAEIKAAVELSEAPEREFARWLNTLPARDIQKHIAPIFTGTNTLVGMRAQRMVEKAFDNAAEREIVDFVKERIAEGGTLVGIKAALDSYVAENIYGQERISQATSELAAKIAEKAYNEQKGITPDNVVDKKQKEKSQAGTKKKAAPLTNNEQKKVDGFAKKMTGKGVNLVDKAEDLPKSEGAAYRAIKDGHKVMGWFNIKTGQVYIYTPNARNYNEVMKTLLHEFVSHKGLRDMLGAKKFDELCRNVWKMMPYEQRLQYAVYVTKNIAIGSQKMQAYIKNLSLYERAALLGNEQVQLAAADEYMAHFAEKGITEQNRSLWKTIADAIRDLLRKIGFDVPLRDSDIARLLYESKNRLTQDMSLEEMTNAITNLNGTNSIGGQVDNRTQNGTRFSIYETQDIAKLNDQFNADLDRYIRNETPQGFRFELGHPSAYLMSAGFPNLPITLRSALLARKAGDKKHPFEASEIRNLVKAIQKPIAIFNYSKDNMRNLIVDTVHNGKHFLIGVTLGYKSGELEVNSVSGMFPKESHEWIKWIQDGKAIRIDQKEKVQDLINSLRTNPAESERIGLNLNSAAKIVQNFENPKLPEENDTRFSISGTQEKTYPSTNPRLWIAPVRGGWTKEKILRRLKESGGSLSGYSTAAKIIAEFNSPEELSSHMFYHGTTNGSGRLLPSITMSDRDVERYGGGGYGNKYWGISVTSDKRVASTFSGMQHHVRILPIILLKGAKVIEMPQLHDAYDLNDHIVELWEQGVDAVWIGDKNGGEKELCVLNPRAIVNIDWADSYQVYNLGGAENPLHIIDQTGIEKLYEDAKHFQELKKTKPSKPDRFEFNEKGEFVRKDETIYQKELDEYYASQELKDWQKADEEARLNIRFSVAPSQSGTQVVPLDEHTLVGLHNISADKLRKALKAGGLANPSAAVIDIAKENHHGYGEISLVMPSALVDSKIGRNVGTYAGDAYTPMYPSVEFRQGKDTEKRIKELVKGLPESIQWQIAKGVGEYMNGIAYESGLQYLFLKERGQEPPMEHATRQHPDISIKEIDKRLGVDGIMAGDSGTGYTAYSKLPAEQLLDFNLWLTCYGDQAKIEHKKSKIDKFRQEGQENAARLLEERYKEPLSFADFDSIHYNIFKDERDNGDEKPAQTINNAIQTIYKQGLSNEFREWQQQVIDNLGYEEVLFAGYTASSNRRYIPNTVENASRLMNQKADTNWNNGEGVSETKALLMDKFKTLSDIRDHKDILENDSEKIKQAYEQTSTDWFRLGIDFRDYTLNDKKAWGLSDNQFIASDEALKRLQEAMLKRNPIAYLNAEYNYSLPEDSEFGKRLMEMKERIKNLPSKYFETKFNRPVYLNEFRNAVIPNNLPQDLRDGLSQAGLGIYEYDPVTETTSRREATLQATEDTGIRFSISNDVRQSELSQEELHERVRTYDENNGTELGRFVDFIERGRVLNEGENPHFKIGKAGNVLQHYGIKGNIFASTETESERRHTRNADHGLTPSEWVEAMESVNTPLAITRYRSNSNRYRVYTFAIKNGKSICLGMDVKNNENAVEISGIEEFTDIRTAFGRDIEQAIRNEEILYPEGSNAEEQIRQNFAQSSAAHNSQLYEQNSVSAAKVGTNFETTKENGENLSENNNTRFSISSYAPETNNTLTESVRQEMQTIRDEAIANGTYMKAPNGKPTHLNERQWLQVRTQAFKKWFGDWENDPKHASKVVDENGEPKVVYHGARTDEEFHTFGNRNNFFIDNKRVAEMFANEYAYQLIVDGEAYTLSKSEAEEIASNIEPYYINDILQLFDEGVDNMLDLISIDNLNDIHEYGGIQCGIDTFDGAESISIKPAPNQLFEVFLNVRNPQITDFGGKTWEVGDDARLTPQSPHDGMIAKNIVEGGYTAEIDGQEPPAATDYVVQSSNQIKSATDNNGDFSESDNDIRFSISDDARKPLTHNERVLRDGIVERLRASGLEVLTDEVGQRVLDLENNGTGVREQRVFHGTGVDFDHFDHSHMGEGEGAQAYGYGTYLTQVEGIGRGYAEKLGREPRIDHLYKGKRASEYPLEDMEGNVAGGIIYYWRRTDDLDKAITYFIEGCDALLERAKDEEIRKRLIAKKNIAESIKKEDFQIIEETPSRFLYTVEIPDDNGSNYFDWTADASTLIERAGISAEECEQNNLHTGEDVYRYLEKREGSDKKASMYLSERGYVGIKYPANFRSGGRADGAQNFVIFNEADAKITDKVRFFRTANGEAYGFTVGGKIYIDTRIADSETLVHEYTHLWATALQQCNSKEWANIVGLMKGTPVWEEVKRTYPELESDNEIADEVLAHYSGRRGAERLREEIERIKNGDGSVIDGVQAIGALERVRKALNKFWKSVADFLHIHFTSAEDVADQVMSDLLNGVNPNAFGVDEKGTRFQIIGEQGAANLDKAEEATTRLDNLQVARDMEQAGKDAKAIRLATGWERGADGKWRYEIPDVGYSDKWKDRNISIYRSMPPADRRTLQRYKNIGYDKLSPALWEKYCKLADKYGYTIEERLTLKDVLVGKNADILFTAYPKLKDVKFSFVWFDQGGSVLGSYNRDENAIKLSNGIQFESQRRDSVLAHEIQHAIQHIERFATGGNQWTVRKELEQIVSESREDAEYATQAKEDFLHLAELAGLLKNVYPKFINSGIENYEQLAVDMYWNAMNELGNNIDSKFPYDDLVHDGKTPYEVAKLGRKIPEAIDELNRLADERKPSKTMMSAKKLVDKLNAALKDYTDAQLYTALAGEVESRNVQSRLGMTEVQRRNTLLQETEDVAREDQIFLQEYAGESNMQLNNEETSDDIRFSIETDEEFENEFGMEEAKNEPIPFENVVGKIQPDEGLREYALRMNAVMNGYSEERMQQIAELVNKRMERGGKWYAKLYRHLYDKYYPLDRFQKALAEQGALLDQRTDAYGDIFRSMGRATTQFQKFYDERFKPLTTLLRSLIESKAVKNFKDVRWADKKTMSERDKITLYLRAKDMVECEEKGLVERGAAGFADFVRHADNALQGWTPQEYVAAFEAAIGKENVSRLWERVNAVNKFSLDYMQEHGFVDEKLVERYKEREFYVPQRGFEEGESHVDLNALRKAEGRKSLSADPLPFMAGIAEQTIMSVEKNRTKQKMLQFAIANMRLGKETGTFDVAKVQYRKTGHILENGLPEYEAVYDGIPQEALQRDAHYRREIIRIKEFLKDENLTDEQREEYLDKIDELEDKIQYASSVRYDQIRPEIPEKINQNRVDVWQNGKHYSILFADRAVADALNRKDGEMGRFVRFLDTSIPFIRRLTQYFSRILTQQNPAFALWNLLRDTGLGFHTNLLEHPSWVGAYSKNLARVQKAVAQYAFAGKYADSNIGKYLQEYFNEGAQTGFSFVNGIEDLQRQISRELKRGNKLDAFVNSNFNPLQLFSNITEWSELTVRVAQYVTAREHGYTPEQAATEAKEVSTNFDRRGNLRLCYNFYSFFNAAMQGTNKHIRQVMNGHGKGLAVSLALLMGAGLLNALLAPDDPDDEMGYTEFDRMQNICLGRIRIPLPPGLRAFWALGVQAALAMQGRKTWNAALVDGATFLFSEIMPINVMGGFDVSESTNRLEFESKLAFREFIPTGLQPLYDLANNTTFNGSTVYREPYLRSQDGKIPQTMLGKRNVNGLIKLSTDKLFELGGGDLSKKTLTKSDGTQVSGFFDVNPSKVEYLIKSATGGIGQFAVDLFNTGYNVFTDNINSFDDFAATMPVIKRAWKPYKEEKEAVRDFYILKGRIEAAKKAEGTMPRERKKILREAERAIAPLDRKGRSPEKATKEQLMKMHNIIIKWNENYW